MWLASQLAAGWRSALLRFGARLSHDGPDQETTVADLPIYDWPQTAAAVAFASSGTWPRQDMVHETSLSRTGASDAQMH